MSLKNAISELARSYHRVDPSTVRLLEDLGDGVFRVKSTAMLQRGEWLIDLRRNEVQEVDDNHVPVDRVLGAVADPATGDALISNVRDRVKARYGATSNVAVDRLVYLIVALALGVVDVEVDRATSPPTLIITPRGA